MSTTVKWVDLILLRVTRASSSESHDEVLEKRSVLSKSERGVLLSSVVYR